MSYPISALDGFDALWSHPLRWFSRLFAFYAIVAVIAAAVVVSGTGIYSYILQSNTVEQPDTVPLPLKKTVPEDSPAIDAPHAYVASAQPEPFVKRETGKEIGVPIYLNGMQIAIVTAVWLDSKGEPQRVTLERTDGVSPKTVIVPYDKVHWHSREQATHTWTHGNETVKGSIRALWGTMENVQDVPKTNP